MSMEGLAEAEDQTLQDFRQKLWPFSHLYWAAQDKQRSGRLALQSSKAGSSTPSFNLKLCWMLKDRQVVNKLSPKFLLVTLKYGHQLHHDTNKTERI